MFALRLKGYRCFTSDFVEIRSDKPVTILIGRNNAGKSQVLDIIEKLCQEHFDSKGLEAECFAALPEELLRNAFNENTRDGELGGNHWAEHGAKLIGKTISWQVKNGKQGSVESVEYEQRYGQRAHADANRRLRGLVEKFWPVFGKKEFVRLLADRNISPELFNSSVALQPDGRGATNVIANYLHSSDRPRELIEKTVLAALQEIFGEDGNFDEITARVHGNNEWEIYLHEPQKGLIPLSASGSGLKTVFLVLLNLLVRPSMARKAPSEFVFGLEELENNLHPALVRRLFRFIERYAVENKTTIFLTTHSSVALDFFGASQNSRLLRVRHDGKSAKAEEVTLHFDRVATIAELGAKASDLLQANCVVWVEGPSDRIYLNRWIQLFSNEELKEGRDYQCACYGGALLSANQFTSPEESDQQLINLLRINNHVVVVCDSDRTAAKGKGSELKPRVSRIQAEFQKIPDARLWITEAKEIENYTPGSAFASALELKDVPDPERFEQIFPSGRKRNFWSIHTGRISYDKVELSAKIVPHLAKETLKQRFDLEEAMAGIIDSIRRWNK
jgi:putative ATP-dependent endonuclease of OLD family